MALRSVKGVKDFMTGLDIRGTVDTPLKRGLA